MADQRNIIFTASLNTTGVTEELKAVDTQVATTNTAVSGGMQKLDQMTGGLVTSFKAARTGIKSAVVGMKTLKGAIAATGVGLLVIAVGSLVAWFTKTEKGAEFLEKATASLGAVFAVLTDKLSGLGGTIKGIFEDPQQALTDFTDSIKTYLLDNIQKMLDGFGFLGEALVKLWNKDFKGAAESAKKGALLLGDGILHLNPATAGLVITTETLVETFEELAPGMKAAADAAAILADRSIQLRKDQRDLNEEFATGRAQIKEYNLTAEDTTKGIEERIAAAESAMSIEQGLMAKRVALAQEEVDIQKGQMALSENLEEDRIALSALEVTLSAVRMESLEMQTTLNNKLNTIKKEGITLDEQAAALLLTELEAEYAALDAFDAVFATAQEKEVDAVAKKYDALLDAAVLYGYDQQALMDQQDKEVEAINQKHLDTLDAQNTAAADKILADEQAVQQSKRDMILNSLGAITALNDAFSAKDEAAAERQFNRNKALSIATATLNTYFAVTDALAKDSTFPGSRFIAAAAAGVTGLAQVIKIKGTEFGSTTAPTPGRIDMPSATGASAVPQLDLGFLGQGSGVEMGRTYVVSQEVTTNQQANQLVSDQAALYQ